MELYDLTRTTLEAQDIPRLKEALADVGLDDLLNLIPELAADERVIVFRLLPKERALALFDGLDVEQQQDLITSFAHEQAAAIFVGLEPDDRSRLLDELPAAVAKRLVETLSPDDRAQLHALLGYEPETAGRIMTPHYVRLTVDMTVEEALAKAREVGQRRETVHTLFVTDGERRLVGAVPLMRLVLAPAGAKVADIMETDITWAATDTDQEDAAKLLQRRDLYGLAVVDHDRRLVGVISADDAMEIMEEEATEDMFHQASLGSFGGQETNRAFRLVNGKVWETWPVRAPFLMVTMFGGLLAGSVIGRFEEAIAAVPMLAMFIPVVMDMGGNAGTQSSTIFARALALGHLNLRQFGKHVLRELGVGLTIGLGLGLVTGTVVALWQGMPRVGLVVGLSLVITMSMATTLGFLVPYGLIKLGADPAAGADPIITTIKDVTGLLIYFVMAYWILGPMLLH